MYRHFLVVAADGIVREGLAKELRDLGFKVTLAVNAAQAERVAQSVAIDGALVESHLPDLPASELRDRLRSVRPDCRVVVLTDFNTVTSSSELLQFGSSDYLIRAEQVVELLNTSDETPDAVGGWGDIGTQSLIGVIDVLVGLLELEYRGFGSTSHVAMELARATAEQMGAPDDMMFEVILGTLLRDLSKDGIESAENAGKVFSDDERKRHIQEHISASLRMFEHVDFPWKVLPVVRHHHECYNGSGAPDGLRGREIPMAARIVRVVDAYVALSSKSGEESISSDQVLQTLAEETGRKFDPEVVEAFNRVVEKRMMGARSGNNPTVLIVVPDRQFRRLLRVRLSNIGLTVREARTYEKCRERLLKSPPDLALIDIDVDPQDAFQLLAEMQQDDNLCRVPIAFLSSRSDRALKLRALRQGVDDYLVNDNMEELIARVENILIRRAVRADGNSRRIGRGITGSLENLGLPDIVQTLTIGMKTACVTLTCGNQQGQIWFENGTPKHAETAQATGEEAFYEMVRWKTGEFNIEHGTQGRRVTIEHDSMFLLMEGLRLIDESNFEAHAS